MPFFIALALAIALLPAVFFLPLPDGLSLPLSLVVRVILPALIATIGLAVASRVYEAWAQGRAIAIGTAAAELRPLIREVLAAGLMAGMVALALVVFLGGAGLILLPLFYGPPIVIQVIALESSPLQHAWPRSRSLLKGNWGRAVLVLLLVVLATAMLSAAALSAAVGITDGIPEAPRLLLLTVLQALIVGLALPFLAAVQVEVYSGLLARAHRS